MAIPYATEINIWACWPETQCSLYVLICQAWLNLNDVVIQFYITICAVLDMIIVACGYKSAPLINGHIDRLFPSDRAETVPPRQQVDSRQFCGLDACHGVREHPVRRQPKLRVRKSF
jgi:hypothetical protein